MYGGVLMSTITGVMYALADVLVDGQDRSFVRVIEGWKRGHAEVPLATKRKMGNIPSSNTS